MRQPKPAHYSNTIGGLHLLQKDTYNVKSFGVLLALKIKARNFSNFNFNSGVQESWRKKDKESKEKYSITKCQQHRQVEAFRVKEPATVTEINNKMSTSGVIL